MKPPRRVRRAIVGGALLVGLLPLALLGVAHLYEGWLSGRYEQHLAQLARALAGGAALDEVARREHAEVRLLDGAGQVVGDSGTYDAAVQPSLLGGLTEGLIERVEPHAAAERLQEIDGAFGELAARPEIRRALGGQAAAARRTSPSGLTEVFYLAAPRAGGGALYAIKASRRGVRRLLALRDELIKLTLYELGMLLLFGLVIGRAVVRPLERLARAARRYPAQPLAEPALLGRRDEIGELARAMTALADDLEQRRRATAELGADVAHEFKNPLATIAASAELIAQTADASPEKRRLVAEHVLAAVERLRRAIDALLALVRLEAALPDEPRAPLDYAPLIAAVVAEYRRDPRWAGVTFTVEVPAGATVRVAAARWQELLRNLIDNALVQPSERREVQVLVARQGGALVTRVRDFGPGVSPGNRAQIFRRFFSQRPAGAPPGTGLGLAIVQAVAVAHGGRAELESTDGAGATFAVTLPA